MKTISRAYILDEIAKIVEPTLGMRRQCIDDLYEPESSEGGSVLPSTPEELEDLIFQSSLDKIDELDDSETSDDMLEAPITPEELEEFILQCPFENEEFHEFLISEDMGRNPEIEIDEEDLEIALDDVNAWSRNQTWLAGDEWPIVINDNDDHSPGIPFFMDYNGYKSYINLREKIR